MIVGPRTRYKSWQVKVKIGGQSYRAVGMPSRSMGLNQARSSCSVDLGELVGTALANRPVQIDVACNGKWRRFFTGFVAPDSASVAPIRRTVNCVDILYRLNRVLGGEDGIIWSNVTWTTAMRDVLNAAGIADGDIAGIYDPGAVYNVGTVVEEIIEPRDSLQQVASELLAFAGAAMFVLPSGKVQIIASNRIPAGSSNLCYSTTPGNSDYRMFGARRTIGLFEDLISSVTASGPAVDLGVAPEATYTIAGITGQAESFSNRFIQSIVPQAETIAEREARAWARLERTFDLDVPLDPDVMPGQSLLFQVPQVGYSGRTPGYIVGVRTSGTGMVITLSLGPSQADGFSSILDPIPDFTATIVRETLDGVPVVDIFLDGSASFSQNQADIISWVWSTDGALYTTSPAQSSTSGTQTQPRWAFVVTDAATVNITLTVSDGLKTESITRAVDLTNAATSGPPLTRVLAVAFGAAFAVTGDGGTTWQTEVDDGDAVAVAPYGAGVDDRAPITASATYGIVASRGASGASGLRETKDLLATHSTVLWSAVSGAIRCLWRNEARPQRLWVGIGQKVYRSIDGGATFVEWGTPLAGQNVNGIIEDPVVLNSVFVLAGNRLQHSTSSTPPGTSWATLFIGPTGAVARTFVRARDGAHTWIAFTGTFAGSPLQRVEGSIAVTFPMVSPAVAEIRALCLFESPTGPQLVAIDSADPARIWLANGEDGTVGASGRTLPAGEIAQHLLADPEVPIAYLATFGATEGWVRKYLLGGDMLLDFRQGATGQQAHMVGLGMQAQQITVKLLVLAAHATNPAMGVWVYDTKTLAWTYHALPGLATDAGWVMVTANRINPDKILALRAEPGGTATLYLSPDAGANWTTVFTGVGLRGDQAPPSVKWNPYSVSQWAFYQHWTESGQNRTDLFLGSDATFDRTQLGEFFFNDRVNFAWTNDNQHLVVTSSGTLKLFNPADTATAPSATPSVAAIPFGTTDVAIGTRRFLSVNVVGNGLGAYRTADWQATAATAVSFTGLSGSAGGNSGGALGENDAILGLRSGGLLLARNIYGSPTFVELLGAYNPRQAATDRQTQTVGASWAIDGGGIPTAFLLYDSSVEQTGVITPDPDMAVAHYVEPVVEVA